VAQIHVTRRTFRDMEAIHGYSVAQWGAQQADAYIQGLYDAFDRIASDPRCGSPHQERSYPFLMLPVARHFVIYEIVRTGIVILTIQHGRRNIEGLLRRLAGEMAADIASIRGNLE